MRPRVRAVRWEAVSEPFTHRLLPYDGVESFVAGAVPFLRAGVAAGDRVMAVTDMARETLLREALGEDARRVEFVDAETWYAHPARTLAECLAEADAAASRGRRLRLLGEPVWTARPPLEVLEWQRAEALANIAFADTGAALMCPYAVRTLPPGIVAAARHTHPETARGARATRNPGFVDPSAYCRRVDSAPLPDPPPDAVVLDLDRPDLYWLRMCVGDYARGCALPEDRLQRLLVAVTEVVTNAVRHGAPPIVLRMWTDADGPGPPALVCEVVDHGEWAPDAGFGHVPPRPGGDGRFGLWAVRLLCSLVQIRTGGGATTVRLWFRHRAGPPRVKGFMQSAHRLDSAAYAERVRDDLDRQVTS